MIDINIESPKTKNDFIKYYYLRWKLLRKPHNQPKGSELDELERLTRPDKSVSEKEINS